jgi:hypothetical protein
MFRMGQARNAFSSATAGTKLTTALDRRDPAINMLEASPDQWVASPSVFPVLGPPGIAIPAIGLDVDTLEVAE